MLDKELTQEERKSERDIALVILGLCIALSFLIEIIASGFNLSALKSACLNGLYVGLGFMFFFLRFDSISGLFFAFFRDKNSH